MNQIIEKSEDMFIADGHCDALLRMWESPNNTFEQKTVVSEQTLAQGGVNMQVFAVFPPVYEARGDQFDVILRQIDLFHQSVVTNEQIAWKPCTPIEATENKTRAILALEGADFVSDDWMRWRLLKRLGVESVGLTWNESNHLAAGCMETKGSGLTNRGRKVVEFLAKEGMILDGAHLNEASYFETVERSGSFFVSHANSRNIHEHPRNLTSEQLQAIKQKNSLVGMTFFPKFINGTTKATYKDLFEHIDDIAGRIGIEHVGFGSDFDGITTAVSGLEDSGKFPQLIEEMLKHYSDTDVKRVVGENYRRFYNDHVNKEKENFLSTN
ncbi:dipeptidase [Geomicrobium sp. JCM 19039]|uniref:dipeptidase n=1 Tax=Geomicrobium sp. JCM 19039 TaxID=1460636 RepID=UPI00045F349F|nr:membrane dipeptidase [Geomicrobium sp. JCM 19039]GAK11028.1 hypothetical protein JCM19039_698 [Geomicrobium sp. JCM 19039]